MRDYGMEFDADLGEYGFDYGRVRRGRRGASHGPFGWEGNTGGRWYTGYEREYRGERPEGFGERRRGFGHYGEPWGGRGPRHQREHGGGWYGEEYGRYGGGYASGSGYRPRSGYEGDLGYGPELGYEGRTGYDRDYGIHRREGPREGRHRKDRRQTYYGDPFHDRERGTPIRMISGEWSRYDQEYARRRGYGRQRRR